MIAQNDPELVDWIFGVVNNTPVEAGGFLHAIVDAACRADSENYTILRPALVELSLKYWKYSYRGNKHGDASTTHGS
jgi:hypothetical protein